MKNDSALQHLLMHSHSHLQRPRAVGCCLQPVQEAAQRQRWVLQLQCVVVLQRALIDDGFHCSQRCWPRADVLDELQRPLPLHVAALARKRSALGLELALCIDSQ